MSRRPSRGHKRTAPNKGRPAISKTVELTIDHIGARGDGVARLGEDQVFVPFTLAGDKVLAAVEGKRGDGLAAELISVLEAGPGRVEPPCPHYGKCGGCALQHVEDGLYRTWKRDLLVTALKRQGLDVPVAELVAIPPGSRRRAAFAFRPRKDGCVLGFNGRASHHIVDVARCLLLDPALEAILPAIRGLIDEVLPGGKGGDVILSLTEGGLDMLIEAEARLDLAARERLAAFADRQDLARLSWRQPGEVFAEPLAARRSAAVLFAEVPVEPPPGAFLQPSKGGEQAIAEIVATAVGAAGAVADLYCGCGSFTFPLARANAVHAVEGDEYLLRALKAGADRAGLSRVTTEIRDLARRPLLPHELKPFAAVVFDPPRAGAIAQAEQLAQAGPGLLVAVSCNPATLGRDLRVLVDAGYRIEQVTPIDQFPWSAHLEAVAVLRR